MQSDAYGVRKGDPSCFLPTISSMTMPHVQASSQRKACKECRRLRLGCDREIPCYNCKRRGCSAICPHGTLEKGARSRSTIIVELQETIAELRSWNYVLEEALRDLQASVSSEPHPLLKDRKPAKQLSTPAHTHHSESPEINDEEVLDALGTFSIRHDSGEFSLHGPTAASEYLVRENPQRIFQHIVTENPRLLPGLMQETSESPMAIPADLILLSALFPFPPEAISIAKLDTFVPTLPPFEQALMLSDLYFTNFAWCTNPIPRPLFMASVLGECYPGDEPAPSLRHISSHILSILFMVFALGALGNINDPRRFVEAEEYHTLARACLCIQPVYESPTLWAAQSMTLVLLYLMCTERRSNGYTLALWSVMARICETLGLNYDQRKLKAGCVEIREQVFWEAMNLDSWQAFTSGRSKSLTFKVISCNRPRDDTPFPGGGWWTWKHNFTAALDSVVERAFREKGSTYSQIQLLENELRNQPPQPAIAWPDQEQHAAVLGAPNDSTRTMQRYMAMGSIETALLHLHRWFFLQAIREMPGDPFEHPFAHSVKTVIQTSHALISALHTMYTYQPAITATFRPFWTHSYSAAMVLCSLVMSCPHIAEAESALTSLDCACDLFQTTAHNRTQTRQALQILLELRDEARQAWAERRASAAQVETLGFWTSVPNPWSSSNSSITPPPHH